MMVRLAPVVLVVKCHFGVGPTNPRKMKHRVAGEWSDTFMFVFSLGGPTKEKPTPRGF